jgi:hypothetical protein
VKIGLYGPLLFQLAVGLRDIGQHDVRFLINRSNPSLAGGMRDEPELSDPDFTEVEDWERRSSLLTPDVSALARRLGEFDVALLSDVGAVFGPGSRKPYAFVPSGYDLTALPFPWRSRELRSRGLPDVSAALLSLLQRRGIAQASTVWASGFRPFREALERLGLPVPSPEDYLPLAFNEGLFRPDFPADSRAGGSERITVFHPSRFLMAETPFLKSIGRYKGNRVLLEGVALARSRGTDVRLTLVERVGGDEASGVRTMIKELGIGEATTWVSGDSQNGLGHVEMVQRYMESDVVADDFGAGWFGGVAIEGAACGRPVMNAVDDDVMHNLYPDHPFLTADSGEEVCMRLESLRDGDYRRQVGEQSARWALEHHGRRNVAERCLRMLERVVS